MRNGNAFIFGLLLVCLPLVTVANEPVTYRIEPIKDNIYRYTYGHYHSVFMVTPAGLFVTDPISKAAATQLRQLLKKQFDVPIRYMAYSHNHVDHIAGGDILADETVTVIAHKDAADDIKMTHLPTAKPNLTFAEDLTVELGDSRVELRYHGPNNGRGSVSMRFLPANVLFVVDWIVIGRMPYRDLLGYDIHGMIISTKEVLAEQPFEVFVGGHAEIGNRQDVKRYLSYLEALYAAVRDGMLAGKNLQTLQKDIQLEEYSDLKMYDEWLPLNIAGVYKTLVEISYFNFRPDINAEF